MRRPMIFAVSGLLLMMTAAVSPQASPKAKSGCGDCGAAKPEVTAAAPKTITVVGTLTDEGIECQALRADDGTLYTLTGKLKKFKVGDRVQVVGEVAEFSFCQQGITLNVRSIKKA